MQNSTSQSACERRPARTETRTYDPDDEAAAPKHNNQQPQVESLDRLVAQLTEEDLEPISPADCIEMYLDDRKEELSKSSLAAHRSGLRFFERFCDKEEIENLNTLTGRDLQRFTIWRRDEAPQKTDTLTKESIKNQLDIVRELLKYGVSINAVSSDLPDKVRTPVISDDEASRSELVDADQAKTVCNHLDKFEHASLTHVVWELLANSGPRIGAIVALDVEDYRANAETPHLRFRHQPETDTPLKNGREGNRLVALSKRACQTLDDYLEQKRPDVADDYGRKPLLATRHGRVSPGTIRKYVYQYTRPCKIGLECPHERDPEECEATTAQNASKCPSSKSPHAIRRGYITHELNAGVDRSYISGRCDVSEDVIERHYDERDQQERMEVRQQALMAARRSNEGYGGD